MLKWVALSGKCLDGSAGGYYWSGAQHNEVRWICSDTKKRLLFWEKTKTFLVCFFAPPGRKKVDAWCWNGCFCWRHKKTSCKSRSVNSTEARSAKRGSVNNTQAHMMKIDEREHRESAFLPRKQFHTKVSFCPESAIGTNREVETARTCVLASHVIVRDLKWEVYTVQKCVPATHTIRAIDIMTSLLPEPAFMPHMQFQVKEMEGWKQVRIVVAIYA